MPRLLWAVVLVVLVREIVGHLQVEGSSIPLVLWNTALLDGNGSLVQMPLHSVLYREELYDTKNHSSGCLLLYIGSLSSNYFISDPLKRVLVKYRTDPAVLGVLVIDTAVTPGYSSFGVPIPEELTLPVFLAGRAAIFLSTLEEEGMNVTIVDLDENEWTKVDGLYNAWVWTLMGGHVVCVAATLYTLFRLCKEGKRLTIASLCLELELVGAVIRMVALVCQWYVMLYNTRFLTTLTMPFFMGSSGLLIFFWLDISSGSLYDGKFLDRMKIPAIVFFSCLFVVEILLDVLDYFDVVRNIYFMCFYMLLCMILGILYIVVAHKIANLKNLVTWERLKPINVKARVCGMLFFGFVVLIVLLATPGCSDYVYLYRLVLYLVYLDIIVISLIQISIFFPYSHKNDKSPNIV